jgi:Fur family ferric uptake transcriptional regulator
MTQFPDLARVTRELHSRGLRLTRLKKAVLATLSQEPALSAEELGSRVGIGSDLSPLYRCLASLEEASIITHLYLADDSRRYVLEQPYGPHHDYMVCSNCSTVEELDCCVDEAVSRQMGRRGFEVQSHQLILRGLCSTCQGCPR